LHIYIDARCVSHRAGEKRTGSIVRPFHGLLVRVAGDVRRELDDTSGTIEPFPNAIAE
jgi:hypothetical protein